MTAYTLTPVGLNGPVKALATTVEGWDLRLIEENARLRAELDEARRVAAERSDLKRRIEEEARLRVRSQARLHAVGAALARVERAHPEAREAVEAARREIWGYEDA